MCSKAAGEGFKIYNLYIKDYLFNSVWTSPVHGISESEKVSGLINIGSVVYNLCVRNTAYITTIDLIQEPNPSRAHH